MLYVLFYNLLLPFLTMHISMSVYIDLPLMLNIPLNVWANKSFSIFYFMSNTTMNFMYIHICAPMELSCRNSFHRSGIDESEGMHISYIDKKINERCLTFIYC